MEIKLDQFIKTLEDFEYLVTVQLDALAGVFDERLIDGLENGKAQKFKICMELCWKAIKVFLKEIEGIDAKSPKQSIKEFYLSGYLLEDDYLSMITAIDDRNSLSHIYKKEIFLDVLSRFPGYLSVFRKIVEVIEKKFQENKKKQKT